LILPPTPKTLEKNSQSSENQRLARRFDFIRNVGSVHRRVGDTGSLFARAADAPCPVVPYKFHLPPLSPPVSYFPGQSEPGLAIGTHSSNILQQGLVGIPRSVLDNVVRVDDKGDQTMLLSDQLDLFLPQL
jgi:hypothetical protein